MVYARRKGRRMRRKVVVSDEGEMIGAGSSDEEGCEDEIAILVRS